MGLFRINELWSFIGIDDYPSDLCADIFIPFFFAFLKTAVQALVVTIVMLPMAVVYVSGLFISTVIALWRLIEQDYGDGGGANLKPALLVLYSLALVQGVLFSCRAYLARAEELVVMKICREYEFVGDDEVKLISDYTEKTKIGCEKDPAFARGRNLITYAVDLIKSEAPAEVTSGVVILARVLLTPHLSTEDLEGQRMLIKQLIGSTSSSRILHKLVQMLDPRWPYNLTIRENAAKIVACLARDIHLRGIQCVASLLSQEYRVLVPHYRLDFEKPYRQSPSSYTKLALEGLRILGKLASDEENCRVMSDTQGLVSKITAPLSSDELHRDHHREWSDMADETIGLLCKLIGAPGEAGQKLRRQISNDTQAISAMEGTLLKCCDDYYCPRMQGNAISMLSNLFFHASDSIASEQGRSRFVQILMRIFGDGSNESNTKKKKAGAELAELSSAAHSKATVTFILEANDTAVKDLTGVLLNTKDKGLRINAAAILNNLSTHYNKDDECFEKLKGCMITDTMPGVLRGILSYGSTGVVEKQTAAEAENNRAFSPPDADLEKGDASQDDSRNAVSSSLERWEDRKLQEALLSLCATVHNKLTTEDPDLARQFDDIAAAICLEQKKPVKTFTYLVKEAQQLLDAKKAQELAIVPAVASAEI